MAEIKVNIKGDDSDLKNKFRESSAEARRFQENVEKTLEAIKESSQTVVSQTGLGGIAKLLGAGGLLGAAEEFGKRLVSGFKDAVTAALDFGKEVGKLRSALGVALGGQAEEWAKRIESISGAMGSFEANIAIFRDLVRGGILPEAAFKNLVDMQNAAKVLGVDLDALGERFAEMKERGEVPERFFHEFPQLAPLVRALGGGEKPSVDWMFKTLLPAIAPGGLQAPVRLGAQQSIRGQIAEDMEQLHKSMIELGQDLLPLVNASLKELKTEMPGITESFKNLGEELQRDIPRIVALMHDFAGTGERIEHPTTAFGKGFQTVNDALDNFETRIGQLLTGSAQILKDSAADQRAANAELYRKLHPE